MDTQTMKQLKEIAKQQGVRGYYAMRKAELVTALATPVTIEPVVNRPASTQTMKQMKEIAKQQGVRGYYAMRKAELIDAVKDPVDLLDSPAPYINKPVLLPQSPTTIPPSEPRPIPPPRYKRWARKRQTLVNIPTGFMKWADDELIKPIKEKVNQVSSWILNHLPESVRPPVKTRLEALKSTISSIYNKIRGSPFKIRETNSAIRRFARQHRIDGRPGIDPDTFLSTVKSLVTKFLENNRQVKFNLVLTCVMERTAIITGVSESSETPFVSRSEINLQGTNVAEIFERARDRILESMAAFQSRGSNWRFVNILGLEINTVNYIPLRGNSYIPLPDKLASKKAIINMKNDDDDECFKWCVTRALNPVEANPERITGLLREQAAALNWNGIEFPVAVKENVYSKFEKNNNIRLNVFGYEEENVYPLYLSKQLSGQYIELLLISNGERQHYCWIKNFNRMLAKRTDTNHSSMHYCRRCLIGYRTIDSLNRHDEYCSQHDPQKSFFQV